MNVLAQIKHDITVRECGGHPTHHFMPNRAAWAKMLDRYAPGCSPTHVDGTNGGTMPCGGWLKELSGERHQHFCASCSSIVT